MRSRSFHRFRGLGGEEWPAGCWLCLDAKICRDILDTEIRLSPTDPIFGEGGARQNIPKRMATEGLNALSNHRSQTWRIGRTCPGGRNCASDDRCFCVGESWSRVEGTLQSMEARMNHTGIIFAFATDGTGNSSGSAFSTSIQQLVGSLGSGIVSQQPWSSFCGAVGEQLPPTHTLMPSPKTTAKINKNVRIRFLITPRGENFAQVANLSRGLRTDW